MESSRLHKEYPVRSQVLTRTAALFLFAGAACTSLPVAAAAQGAGMQPVQDNRQAGQGGQARETELPIRNITLYRSGVGYFERQAVVEGQQEIQVRFNVEQINDILKSMVVLDLDGGRIDSVGYGSKAPLDRRLAAFGVDVSDNPDIATLLNRLRGAPIRIVTADGPITGTVLGVESRPKAAGERQIVQVPFVNLLTESGVRSVDLSMVASFEILDRDLAGELSKALAALAEHRADRIKTVDLSFSGQGERRIVVAYVHEMPVWKTSYRLVLPDAPTGADAQREAETLTMQGWAIVENTSDEDWENVRLSLVAGRPVSFEMDLYEPLFAQRPRVPVPVLAGVMPRVYQAAVREMRQQAEVMRPPASMVGARRGLASSAAEPEMAFESGDRRFDLSADDLAKYSPAAAAQAGEIGQVFQYQLQAPVSIARQRSAMLPILNADVEGRRLSIYNRADRADHPMRGVQVVNTSGLQLMPGPISVFDGPSYAGDAQIGHIAAGDKRLLAYAVDLDVDAMVSDDSRTSLSRIRVVDGMIEEITQRRASTSYVLNNKDTKRPRLILVEHQRLGGWQLAAPRDFAEETPDLYRFEVAAAAGKTGELVVVQERTDRQRVAMTEYDLPRLLAYSQDGRASGDVVAAVRKAVDMQSEINTIKRRIAQLDQERSTIHQEQNRIRQNMGSVGRDSDLYRQYVQRLTQQETRLDELGTQREEQVRQQEAKERELNEYLRNLNVE
jgi:hypothetical protein